MSSTHHHHLIRSIYSTETSCEEMEAAFLTSAKSTELIFSARGQTALQRSQYRRAPSSPSIVKCCQQSYEDDGKPVVKGDWRSFRARLIHGEKEASSAEAPLASFDPDAGPNSTKLGAKWAHTIHEPERGCLLIATEKLDGVHIFERTVILILSTGPVGPTGIILNRPSLMSIKETRSTILDQAGTFSGSKLFFGGPLDEALFLLAEGGDDSSVGQTGVFEPVIKGLYYGTKESVGCAAEMVKRSVVDVQDFRFYDGYCGWEKEQLRDEIRAGYWTVAACSPAVVELAGEKSLGFWEEVLWLMGTGGHTGRFNR
uniref:Uncharacterized protein n=1 Tax=Kalanchoe fedtschenkoi TaxID=63787 RepID=A0A7N0V131_KALFE